jgi:hypothetical protein
MSWLRVAFNLLREAAGTEEGREVIQNVRSAMRKEPEAGTSRTGPDIETVQSLITEHRAQLDRNIEAIVQMLNAQNATLAETSRRQRLWNIALVAGIVIAIVVAFLT